MTIGTPQPFRGGQGLFDWFMVGLVVGVAGGVSYWWFS